VNALCVSPLCRYAASNSARRSSQRSVPPQRLCRSRRICHHYDTLPHSSYVVTRHPGRRLRTRALGVSISASPKCSGTGTRILPPTG
jgi:hypothetical protein